MIERFDLRGVDDELARRREGADRRPASLRALADYFNREVLQSAIEEAGGSPLDGEVENSYRLLTDEEISSGTRTRARKRLEGEGVDLEAVERGFVSHPTINAHLKECLGVERPRKTGPPVESAKERVFKMQSRSEAVIENTVARLAANGQIDAGSLAVTVDAQISCETCGVHGEVGQFLERGGCDCERSDVN